MTTYTQTQLANAGRNDPKVQEVVQGIIEDMDIKPIPLLAVVQRATTIAISALTSLHTNQGKDADMLFILATAADILVGGSTHKIDKALGNPQREIIHKQLMTILKLCRHGDEKLVGCELEILHKRLK